MSRVLEMIALNSAKLGLHEKHRKKITEKETLLTGRSGSMPAKFVVEGCGAYQHFSSCVRNLVDFKNTV